jgi:putative IMPACT (imprinted ancient) family translation regulator
MEEVANHPYATAANHMTESATPTTISIWKQDHEDDGEVGAGARLSHLLHVRNERNVLVVVSRWYGGIHLGSRRFAHITAVAQAVLSEFHEQNKK